MATSKIKLGLSSLLGFYKQSFSREYMVVGQVCYMCKLKKRRRRASRCFFERTCSVAKRIPCRRKLYTRIDPPPHPNCIHTRHESCTYRHCNRHFFPLLLLFFLSSKRGGGKWGPFFFSFRFLWLLSGVKARKEAEEAAEYSVCSAVWMEIYINLCMNSKARPKVGYFFQARRP